MSRATRILLFSLVICAFFIIGFFIYAINDKDRFPINVVGVNGEIRYTSKQELTDLVSLYTNKSFFFVDLKKLNIELKNLAWIKSVKVQRKWPDKIILDVVERIPLALWENSGIVTTEGKLLLLQDVSLLESLPNFKGSRYKIKDIQEQYLKFTGMLTPKGLTLREISYLPDYSWDIKLDNGILVRLGSNDIVERLDRFLMAYHNSLKKHSSKIAHVDMRYVNGVAIGWKAGVIRPKIGEVIN